MRVFARAFMTLCRHKGLQSCWGHPLTDAVSYSNGSTGSIKIMKSAVAGLLIASSAAFLGGCAVYPDGSSYGGGYPGVYDDPGYGGYYGGPPVVQPGVVVGGGYYSGPAYYGPGRSRYWDDGPGWRRPPPGGWHGNQQPRDRGPGGPPPQAGGNGHPNGPPPQAGGGRPPAPPPPQASGAPMPKAVGGQPPGPNRPPPPSANGGNRESGNSRGFLGRYGG